MTPRHIGIVACSAEGAALCYRTICVEGVSILGTHAHPEVTVHTFSLADYMACIYREDWASLGELMLASANKLKAVGADFLICPDNTIVRGPFRHRPPSAAERRKRSPVKPRCITRSARVNASVRLLSSTVVNKSG